MILLIVLPNELNITQLSQKIGINRTTLYHYIHYLTLGNLFYALRANAKGDTLFNKPSKLYLGNPNLSHYYCQNAQKGTVREQFFASMLRLNHHLSYPAKGDFYVDNHYTFEVGGKNKDFKQIANIPHSFIASDGTESGFGNKIPLWLFGFLY